MKIIFLDVDGVLITEKSIVEQYYRNNKKPSSGYRQDFDVDCMNNLKEIVQISNANIVISSTWRLGDHSTDKGWIALLDRLNDYGLKERVIGYTPDLSWEYNNNFSKRGMEVQRWLDNNKDKDIDGFVIIDDDSDMFHLMPKLAKCSFKTGITNEVKFNALDIILK